MKEPNKDKYKKALKNLPQANTPDGCWNQITQKLSNKEEIKLRKALNSLPQRKAGTAIWLKIEKELSEKNTGRLISVKLNNVIKIAALFIIFIGVLNVLKYYNKPARSEKNQYRVVIASQGHQLPNDNDDNMLSTIIRQYCSQSPEICSNEEFLELNKLLVEVQIEVENLNRINRKRGNAQLNKYLLRLNNQKIEIQKEMLQIFI